MLRTFVLSVVIGMMTTLVYPVHGQENFTTRLSPLALAATRYKDAYIKITYSQPQKKDREIFGKLVPFDQVWRLGANEATEMTITKDIIVNNVIVKAGTYSLFAIPRADRWTFIVNTDTGLWGAYNYNPKLDLLRFDIPVEKNDQTIEAFTISLNQKNELADILIMWDKTKLSIPIKFTN